ncbi:craniofacial development protein 1-like [Liolophura sinensis]|uniref:craniofacial development protein 1-like n=1 Tax=Liolophura sinensis TaxID=3198878 RepID=UPI003158C3DE
MSDEEDYSSADDEDYVPSDKECLSEEDESGEEEDLTVLNDGGSSENRTATGKGKRKNKSNELMPRKRRGGIKLDGDDRGETTPQIDEDNQKLKEEIAMEKEISKVEKEKKKADDLWASFLSDVGQKPKSKPTPAPSASTLGFLTGQQTKSKPDPTKMTSNGDGGKTPVSVQQKITVTKVFDFAGEEVKVKEEVDIQSKEGQKELKRLEEEKSESEKQKTDKPVIGRILGQKPAADSSPKAAGGLGSVLGKIGKKNKLSSLTKSKLDWDSYKKQEGIEEDLKIHNRGKDGYIERMAFLQRADVRQFEIEKNMRQSASKR